jgi:hypothetical protein
MRSLAARVYGLLVMAIVVAALLQWLGGASAMMSAPAPMDRIIRQEWREPFGKFLGAMGALSDLQAILDRTKMRELGRNEAVFQVEAEESCPTGTEGCLTVIGKSPFENVSG